MSLQSVDIGGKFQCSFNRMVRIYTVHQENPEERVEAVDPDVSIQEWRTEVNKRSNIDWEEKPEKVNLYSQNVIQETDNTDTVDRDSIANLSNTRQHWETKLKPVEGSPQKPKPSPSAGKVRHWEVKLPTPLRTVPADAIRSTKDDSDSETDTMASTEYANESAIEREIRLANEREELLRKEQEERLKLAERQNASQAKISVKETYKEQNNNGEEEDERATYYEMTEADRGSELQQREELIQLEIQEQEAREAEIREEKYQVEDSPIQKGDNANESIIEREIRLQQEREMEVAQLRNSQIQTPVDEDLVQQMPVSVQETVPTSPTSVATPDTLSEPEDDARSRPEPRTRISYEEAIANASHEGESLIARELREAREREEELQRQRERLSGVSVKPNQSPHTSKTPQSSTPMTPKETNRSSFAEVATPTYQNDVSPFKETRRQSQDSASSHNTDKVTPKSVKVPAFGGQLNYRTPERKDKNVKKPETPIEREMRLARERENEYRISKGLPPLPDIKREIDNVEFEEEKEEVSFSKSPFLNHGNTFNRDASMKKFASSRLQKEINQQNQLEKKYREEGKIMSTSEDHVGALRYTELAPSDSMPAKRNFSITRKSTSSLPTEPETKQNGTADPQLTPKSQEPKFNRSVSSGVTFTYKESRHKAESKIEQELREMREREEELRSQRSNAGLMSPNGPDSPRNQDNQSVVSKRSQFEQTS